MGRVRSIAAILLTFVLATTIRAQVVDGEVHPEIDPQFHHLLRDQAGHSSLGYRRPDVKFTFDATVQQRSGTGGPDPLILDGPFPLGAPLVTTDDLDFDGVWGLRLELIVFDPTPNPTDLRLSYMWTGRGETRETGRSNPADVLFFNIVDAAPANSYTARYRSEISLGDIGVRRENHRGIGLAGGLAFGELKESLDLLTAPSTGFFSQGRNQLYGVDVAVDAQLFAFGLTRIEGGAGFGVYYNDIEIQAQSQNWQKRWTDSHTAYSATGNIAWVVPAYPFNFRFGYQATFVGGVGLLPDNSVNLRLFDGGGGIETDDAVWHGFLFGIEYLR